MSPQHIKAIDEALLCLSFTHTRTATGHEWECVQSDYAVINLSD